MEVCYGVNKTHVFMGVLLLILLFLWWMKELTPRTLLFRLWMLLKTCGDAKDKIDRWPWSLGRSLMQIKESYLGLVFTGILWWCAEYLLVSLPLARRGNICMHR